MLQLLNYFKRKHCILNFNEHLAKPVSHLAKPVSHLAKPVSQRLGQVGELYVQ